MKKHENGFSAIEVIILVVVLLLLAGVGFIAYNQLTKKTTTQSSTTGTSASDTSTSKEADSVKLAVTSTVQKFYDELYTGKEQSSSQRSAVIQKYGTQHAIDTFTSNEARCLQNYPASVSVKSVTNGAAPYNVDVTYNYTGEGATSPVFHVTVDVVGADLKIDGVTCDNPMPENGTM